MLSVIKYGYFSQTGDLSSCLLYYNIKNATFNITESILAIKL